MLRQLLALLAMLLSLAPAIAVRADGAGDLTAELKPPAERRCTEPQAIRLTQYDACIKLYGAFVDGARRERAERLCGCVARHVVRHFRELPLPLLRTRAIDASLAGGMRGSG